MIGSYSIALYRYLVREDRIFLGLTTMTLGVAIAPPDGLLTRDVV